MRCKEKSLRCAAEPVGNELEEALFIQSESALLQQHLTTIQQQRDDLDVTRMCKEVSSAVHVKPDPVTREGQSDADRHRTDTCSRVEAEK